MNKGQLITKIAEDANLTRQQAAEALDATLNAISDSLKDGEKTSIPGFGTFAPTMRKARKGFNPRTLKPIDIPAKTAVRFKPGKGLMESLN